MYRFWAILLCAPLFAETLPNRYIVEFSSPPVAAQLGRSRSLLRSPAAERYRAQIRNEQATARQAIVRDGGRVLGAIENLRNAMFVEMPAAQAAQLANLPGVRQVHPVRIFHLTLDHALPLHHVLDAWTQVGLTNAGAGSKIAIIDTGIEIGHPGFADAGLSAPTGFPVADSDDDLAFTNNKVIVARSYAKLFASPEPDPSVRDHVGHGTATAMAAAGVSNAGPLATISGVAPQAYLGVYKVFGTPGVNSGAPEDAVVQAIEDAVSDGMDIINLSLGSGVAGDLSSDPLVEAVEAASSLGVIIVISAGNSGPNPGTIGSPATAPHAISVGGTNNDRAFTSSVQPASGAAVTALPGAGPNSFAPISGGLIDVATLDASGLACNALPANSLNGSIPLILRGSCNFEVKLQNAAAAGAVAAVVYDNIPKENPVLMGVGAATLPAVMVANQDGLNLQQQIGAGLTVTIQFYSPSFVNPQSLASFSSAGPNVDYSIKPDLVGVAQNFYTAAQTLDSAGELYNPTGYVITQGTSFSAPLVSGAAALLKSARPGLTVDEYRSLLIDSADVAYSVPGTPARVQQAGGGFLNLFSALNATAALAPASFSFGTANGTANLQQILTVTNVGTAADTFQLSAWARDPGAPVPQFPTTSVRLDPGASATVPVAFSADGLSAGQYEGAIAVQAVSSGTLAKAPYWFGVPSGEAATISVLEQTTAATAGKSLNNAIVFRVIDSSGISVASVVPSVRAVSGGGRVLGVAPVGGDYPGDFAAGVRLGTTAGANVFQIQAGGATVTITITGQ